MALRPLRVARKLAVCVAVFSGASVWLAGSAGATTRAQSFTGYAFDACTAPSVTALRAWLASPFRGLNIYIGGGDRACTQPHLSRDWVRAVTGMGWRLIPTYVSLQAPHPSCRCTSMVARRANEEGVAAADNAVRAAARLGIGRGNPIYDDMESYALGRVNRRAVTAFLQGWTGRLHARGYLSGVYSSAGTGISELVSEVGSSFSEPNDIWIGDWNRRATADDPYVPAADWAHRQRIHQYRGGHIDSFGGIRINIDTDYARGAVVTGRTLSS